MKRTQWALLVAWIFGIFAFFAHGAAMTALVTDKIVFGIDFTSWLFISLSEGILSVIAYLDSHAHRIGVWSGKPNE